MRYDFCYTSTMTKETLLHNTNPKEIIELIARHFESLRDEEAQEMCLEEIYELLAANTPQPTNFSLLNDDQKAQHDIDVDMLLITIEFKDIGIYVFKDENDLAYFWSLVPKTEKSEAIFQKIF